MPDVMWNYVAKKVDACLLIRKRSTQVIYEVCELYLLLICEIWANMSNLY